MTTQIVTKIEMISAAGCANIMPFNPKILFKIIIDGIKNNPCLPIFNIPPINAFPVERYNVAKVNWKPKVKNKMVLYLNAFSPIFITSGSLIIILIISLENMKITIDHIKEYKVVILNCTQNLGHKIGGVVFSWVN